MERYSFWPNWYIGDMMADLLADAGDCRAYRYTRESAFGEPEAEAVLQVMTVAGTEEAAIREKLEKIGALRQYPVFLVPEETHIEAAPDGRGQNVYLRVPAAEPLGRYADGNRLEEKDLDSLEQQLRDALAICGSRGISYGEIRPGDLFVGADGRLLLGTSALLRNPGAAVQSPEQLRGVLLTAAGAAAGAAHGRQLRICVHDTRSRYVAGGQLYRAAFGGQQPARLLRMERRRARRQAV